MPSGSPRDAALGGIIALVSMSFLTGVFLMVGLQQWLRNDPLYIAAIVVIPLLIFAAVLNARRILKVVG